MDMVEYTWTDGLNKDFEHFYQLTEAYCQTAHCGRCEQHFIVGAFTSPTVRFGR